MISFGKFKKNLIEKHLLKFTWFSSKRIPDGEKAGFKRTLKTLQSKPIESAN